MKRGGCKFGGSKTEAVLCPNRGRGAVVSQLVLKLKESVPPPPPGTHLVRYLSGEVLKQSLILPAGSKGRGNLTWGLQGLPHLSRGGFKP